MPSIIKHLFFAAAIVPVAASVLAQAPQMGSPRARGVIVIRPDAAADTSPAPVPPNTAPKPVVSPVIRACARPFASPDITLIEGGDIRKPLAARLKTGRPVVVDWARPYAQDGAAPPALEPWLAEVRASGGTVTTAAYCQQTRGAFDFLKRLLGISTDPGRPYRAARDYDVVLHADALDRVVTQVEFRPRQARTS